jgi:formylmethanofuran dehydrogenase subunit C
MKSETNRVETNEPSFRSKFGITFLISLLFLISINAFSQTFISKDNTPASLNWTDPSTWDVKPGTAAPLQTLSTENITIKGYVTLNGSLVLNGPGLLYVQDTLVITGDLDMPNVNNFTALRVGAGGLVIVLGDYSSKNKVDVANGGSIVVGGTLSSNGGQADYTGEAGSALYAVGGTQGNPYGLTDCTTSVDPSCIGNATQLSQTPIGQFFSSLTNPFSISVSSTCYSGGNLNLSYSPTPATGEITSIKWYRDGTQIHNWESVSSITEYSAGNYSSSYVRVSDGKTYWAKGIAVLGSTGSVSGNTSVLAGSSNTYTLNTVTTNATYYQWTVPSGSVITSGQGTRTITVMAGTQVGQVSVTPTNGSSLGCASSLMVNIRDASCDCSTTGAYWSKNNYTGAWTDANSWGNANVAWNPNPPSTTGTGSGAGNSMCISGTITMTGDLTLTGGTKTICDTLIVTGNLNATSTVLDITSTGVLIVLGNFTGGSGNLSDNGKLIVAGAASIPNSFSYNGSGTSYLFNPVLVQGFTPTGTTLISLQTNDPSLYNTYMNILCGSGISGGTVGINRTICSGADVPAFTSVSDASPVGGITYQWFMSTNSSNPATGTWSQISGISNNTYDHGTLAQTTYFYRKATKGGGCSANSNVLTITVNSAPSLTNQTAAVCSGNAFTVAPAGVPSGTTYTWTAPAISPVSSITGAAAQATGQSSISQTLVNATSNNATATYSVTPTSGTCIGSNFSVTVTVYPKPAFTLGTLPSVCVGESAFNIPYTSPTGTPTTYSVSNGVPAAPGFSIITDATISGTPISILMPGTLTVGNYQLILSLKNTNGCLSDNYSLTLKIIPKPDTGDFYRKPNN